VAPAGLHNQRLANDSAAPDAERVPVDDVDAASTAGYGMRADVGHLSSNVRRDEHSNSSWSVHCGCRDNNLQTRRQGRALVRVGRGYLRPSMLP